MNNRIIFSKASSLSDFSVALCKYYGETKKFTQEVGDFLYIGSRLPFNHIYFKLKSASTAEANMKIQYFDGTKWIDAVETIDETLGFTKSGVVQFTPNRDKGWAMRSTNYNGEKVLGLESIVIYDFYWTRISFSAPLTEVDIQWVGNLFSNDSDLEVEFPDLCKPKVLTSVKIGKTDWEEQHVAASKVLVDDLVNKGIVCGPGQILDWREFTLACVQKTAEIAMGSFGNDYTDEIIAARKEYNQRLDRRYSRIDRNNNAAEDPDERYNPTGYFSR